MWRILALTWISNLLRFKDPVSTSSQILHQQLAIKQITTFSKLDVSHHNAMAYDRHIQSVWAIGMLSQGLIVAPLYRYTSQVSPRFRDSGSLENWKWCHNIMFEANVYLRLLHTCILDINKVFKPLVCCLKGIWLHPSSEVAPCPLLPWYCVKSSWNIWFRNYQHVFYLEKVIFHLGKDCVCFHPYYNWVYGPWWHSMSYGK